MKFDDVTFTLGSLPPLPPLPTPKLPDPLSPEFQKKITDDINKGFADWQESGGPNRMLVGEPGDKSRLMRVLLMMATLFSIIVLLFLLNRVRSRRYNSDRSPVPDDSGRVAASGVPGSIARRREEILQSGQYGGVVREYLRTLFFDRGIENAHSNNPGPMPVLTGVDAKHLRAEIELFWTIAYEPTLRPILYSRWKELEPMMNSVKTSADADRWRFVSDKGAA
jgi:hypothetical protein